MLDFCTIQVRSQADYVGGAADYCAASRQACAANRLASASRQASSVYRQASTASPDVAGELSVVSDGGGGEERSGLRRSGMDDGAVRAWRSGDAPRGVVGRLRARP